ncbi:hypothetical protein [Hyphomonas johnsonii]|jgi:hypothetical protein|uniref:Uncharacterized protein n=1 Tax=Hyphomonas johnsonii MHS-2 TaxID=1280950 RepID=A0A059FBD8_9PROT|nr:hypothetical protein [Hyphomonas johnsonii]KCZ87929.1 hypothetical protein HJO_16135 [Hyphomonas johnsonii MHS-2]
MSGAVISRVQLAATHDGEAGLMVTIRFENGGETPVALDEHAVRILLESCRAEHPDQLVGRGWGHVRDALEASSNRFMNSNDQ